MTKQHFLEHEEKFNPEKYYTTSQNKKISLIQTN